MTTTEILILVQTVGIILTIVSLIAMWYLYLTEVSRRIKQGSCEHKSWSSYSDEKETRKHCLDCGKKLKTGKNDVL